MDTSKEYIEMLRKLAQQCHEMEEGSFIQDGWQMQKGDFVLEYLPYHQECFLITRPHIRQRTSDGTQIYNHSYIFKGVHLDIGLPDSEVLDKIQVRTVAVQNLIWLPRQDQLQEMVEKEDIGGLVWRFTQWWNVQRVGKSCRLSFEQLWLAYVMKEKYNKVWNDKEWVIAIS